MKTIFKYVTKTAMVFGFGLSVTSMAGCEMNNNVDRAAAEVVHPNSELEPLYSFDVKGHRLTIMVQSFGCTKVEHFELNSQLGDNGEQFATVVRTKPDLCRAMPRLMPISMRLQYDSLDYAVMVTNPVGEQHFPLIKKKQ